MATKAQLEAEVWWREEFVPPGLRALAISLRIFFGVDANSIGSKGDYNHLRGYHRSRAWIKNSHWCTDRTYSVSRTPGDRSGGDSNWVTAMDIGGIPQSELMAMCKRLDEAVRAGRFEKITEWYGNINGDSRVDGYDNISNVLATSDSSHLTHLHLSFDRGRADENHTDLLAVLTGEDMTPIQAAQLEDCYSILFGLAKGMDSVTVHDKDGVQDLRPYYTKVASFVNVSTAGGLTEEQIRAIVRAELDKTHLAGA